MGAHSGSGGQGDGHDGHDGHDVRAFIDTWRAAGASERGNYQLFLSGLCDLLGVERPRAAMAETEANDYVFERAVEHRFTDGATTTRFIDLYKRDCFVLEAKQGSDRQEPRQESLPLPADAAPAKRRKGTAVRGTQSWHDEMAKAYGQAKGYAEDLPIDHGWPPFILVVDVGHVIDVYADFSGTGKGYTPFPDPRSHRIHLESLLDEDIRERLRLVWSDPAALDPGRKSARVTREIADHLAALARSLEAAGHSAERTAGFLMRCLFTMFAEDVGLLPDHGFTRLLGERRGEPAILARSMQALWRSMDKGGFDSFLGRDILHFNGGLFQDTGAIELTPQQADLLIEAAQADWREVEPAIFGTLLERALDKRERHKLGAHYTPRAYVERLVMPTVIEPLRQEWEGVTAAVVRLNDNGKPGEAVKALKAFHDKLCATRVLDPACGSGNFLYVTMEHMKRLEGEVLNALYELDQEQYGLEMDRSAVTPDQFLGLEVNPRAAAIAELVLWIGYLQMHFKSREGMPGTPILRKFDNIRHQDAILAYGEAKLRTDAKGRPVTQWDGVTMKTHPTTGREVPDETARKEVQDYTNPRPAEWPDADYVVGNPPFIGNWRMRGALGDGYVEALRKTIPDVPESVDFVMYWWDKAAGLLREGKIRRFGLITTNSLRQAFARRVIERHMTGKSRLSLVFAVPDHPWVDAGDGADVRIAMTVAEKGEKPGRLLTVTSEAKQAADHRKVALDAQKGAIHANLRIGADTTKAKPLKANDGLSCPGVKLHGSGFIVTEEEAKALGLGSRPGVEDHIRRYRNGRDITQTPRGVRVIDLFGLDEHDLRGRFPEIYQWVYERVRPQRVAAAGRTPDSNQYAQTWWLFGKTRGELRDALSSLTRYIATVETSKHRFFVFLDGDVLPDNMLVNIALDDAFFLGVLSSRIHVAWALAAGGTLEDRPRYNKTRCFDPFPFPACTEAQQEKIRALGEQLDAHRKARQVAHPGLTMTGLYNVLEKLRVGAALTDKEREVHEEGLVSVLKQIHDDLDAAVAAAYGWPADLDEEAVLERLVALNQQRAAEEMRGHVRWLRPEYQAPDLGETSGEGRAQVQEDLGIAAAEVQAQTAGKLPWPKAIPDQARAIRVALAEQPGPVTPEQLARAFRNARRERVGELLSTLAALGQARKTDDGRYAG